MAWLPGITNTLPGVYGPTCTTIERSGSIYAIGWNPIPQWGQPWFRGTIKELAARIFHVYCETSANGYGRACAIGTDEEIRKLVESGKLTSVLVFLVSFKPDVKCILEANCDPDDNVNINAFLSQLTEEMQRFKPLIPFS